MNRSWKRSHIKHCRKLWFETVEVDLSGLKAGDVVKVKDLAIAADKDVVLVTDPEAVVVTVTVPHNAPIPETDAEEAEEAEK